MSTCDVLMVTSAALFTENIYKSYVAPNMPDKHYIFVGRAASVIVVLLHFFFAFTLDSVVSGLEIFWKVSSMMAVAFWGGLFGVGRQLLALGRATSSQHSLRSCSLVSYSCLVGLSGTLTGVLLRFCLK